MYFHGTFFLFCAFIWNCAHIGAQVSCLMKHKSVEGLYSFFEDFIGRISFLTHSPAWRSFSNEFGAKHPSSISSTESLILKIQNVHECIRQFFRKYQIYSSIYNRMWACDRLYIKIQKSLFLPMLLPCNIWPAASIADTITWIMPCYTAIPSPKTTLSDRQSRQRD